MKKLYRRIKVSPAMIVAVIALIAAVGGTAVAASTVTSKQFKKAVRGPLVYKSAVFTVPAGTFARGQVNCDSGQLPLGGGAQVADENNDFLNSTFPSGTGWVSSVFNSGAVAHSSTVWVVCGKIKS